ncbi:MAG: 5-methylcytosine restriction system specificity protein McrC, partial [Rhodoplanes sp.]
AAAVEASPDFPALVARLLCYAVDRRLRRNLSRGYQQKQAVLTRVKGRIDILDTYTGDLLSKGMIACRFEELTFDTPRNRLVRAALDALASRVDDSLLAHEVRTPGRGSWSAGSRWHEAFPRRDERRPHRTA